MLDERKVFAVAALAIEEKDFLLAEQVLRLAKRYVLMDGGVRYFAVEHRKCFANRESAIRECVESYQHNGIAVSGQPMTPHSREFSEP